MLKNFIIAEDGAVTVDWVVLTAAIVGLGIAVLTTVGEATTGVADQIAENLEETSVKDWLGTSTTTTTP